MVRYIADTLKYCADLEEIIKGSLKINNMLDGFQEGGMTICSPGMEDLKTFHRTVSKPEGWFAPDAFQFVL